MSATWRLLVTAGLVLTTAGGAAATCPEVLGRWPYGWTEAVVVDANRAFLGRGHALLTADVSVPGQPRRLGELQLPAVVQDLAVQGSTLYVADGEAGLRVVDVSDLSAPRELAVLPLAGEVTGVAASGASLFLAHGDLSRVEVGDPFRPHVTWTLATDGTARSVAMAGTRVVVAVRGNGMLVVDPSSPGAPSVVGRLAEPRFARHVAVEGDRALVTGYHRDSGLGYDNAVAIVDISDPARPVELGLYLDRDAVRSAPVGEHVLLAAGSEGLLVLDASDPSRPTLAATVPAVVRAVTVADGFAYLGDRPALVVLDVADPPVPTEIGRLGIPSGPVEVALADGLAYVLDDAGRLSVVDLADPRQPLTRGSSLTGGQVADMVAGAGLLLEAAGSSGLRVVDVGDPDRPSVLATVLAGGTVTAAALWGDRALVGLDEGGVVVFDLGHPEQPVELGRCTTPTPVRWLAVDGDLAYVADGDLEVVDLADPTRPARIATLDAPFPYMTVRAAVDRGSLFITDEARDHISSGWVYVVSAVDVSNPTSPERVGGPSSFFSGPQGADGLDVSDRLGVILAHCAGLSVLDVSDPLRRQWVGRGPDTAGCAVDFALMEDLAVVAEWSGGLEVYSLSQCHLGSPPRRPAGRLPRPSRR